MIELSSKVKKNLEKVSRFKLITLMPEQCKIHLHFQDFLL